MCIDIFVISMLFYAIVILFSFYFYNNAGPDATGFFSFMPIIATFYPYQNIIHILFSGDILFISFFVVEVLYYFIFELSPLRGTIGHKIVGINVVDKNAKNVNWKFLLVRSLIKTLSRYLYCLPMISACFSQKSQALHDILAGSFVLDNTEK